SVNAAINPRRAATYIPNNAGTAVNNTPDAATANDTSHNRVATNVNTPVNTHAPRGRDEYTTAEYAANGAANGTHTPEPSTDVTNNPGTHHTDNDINTAATVATPNTTNGHTRRTTNTTTTTTCNPNPAHGPNRGWPSPFSTFPMATRTLARIRAESRKRSDAAGRNLRVRCSSAVLAGCTTSPPPYMIGFALSWS
ncbi:hypothetical protein, partial [Streptomyces longispororuber]|uniref:hypothetical protein n=1 Tax=Streptomyces longispororuber TaxID=68230 RepID=UPI003702FC39